MLSKIRTASALGGQLWIKDLPGSKPGSCPRTWCAVIRLGFRCVSGVSFNLTLYHSAASDVLANFLRLSKFQSRVNLSLNFVWYFSQTVPGRLTVRKSAKCQNIHAARNLPRSLGFFFDCSDLGLDSAGPWLVAVIKRLDCAPSSLSSPYGAKVRSFVLLSKNTALSTFVQAGSSLRLPESINGRRIMQPARPVKNLGFLLETAI